ncbi:hypothetical protein BDC45DRAFT_564021 [Circinella umbellata]|nr:hypothetical protein BDC45DRAFT_564021 [Circinella umbellata]
MLKQIPTPSQEDLRTALGPDFEDQWHQDKVTCWLQEKGWDPIIANTFRDHDIYGQEFFNITLAKLVEILPRQVTTYAERRRLLNDIRALGTPAVLNGQLSPLAAPPAHISINTNVYPSYGNNSNRSPSIPSAGTPNSSGQLASSNSPTTPLSASRYNISTTATNITTTNPNSIPTNPSSTTKITTGTHHLMEHHHHHHHHTHHSTTPTSAKEPNNNSGISFISRHNSPSPSPSSSEFPSSFPRNTSRHNSPTRYSPKVAFSKFRNTFLSTTNTTNNNNNNNNNNNTRPLPPVPYTSCSSNISPSSLGPNSITCNNISPSQQQTPLISPRTSSMNYDTTVFEVVETEERNTSKSHHHHHYSSRFSSTPDKLSKIWAAYSNWRSPTSHHRTSKGHATSPSSSSSSSLSSGVTHQHHQHQQIMDSKKNTSGLGLATHKRFTEQRIQVTSDKETWYSVVVTDIRDSDSIKERILKRLELQGNLDDFYYFHENETPLASQDILNLCSIADHSANQHILVCFMEHYLSSRQQQSDDSYRYLQATGTVMEINHCYEPGTTIINNGGGLYGNSAYSLSTPELGHSPSDTPSSPHLNTLHYHHQHQQHKSHHSPISANGMDNKDTSLGNNSPFVFPSSNNNHHASKTVYRHNSREILSGYDSEPVVGVQLSDPPTPCQPDRIGRSQSVENDEDNRQDHIGLLIEQQQHNEVKDERENELFIHKQHKQQHRQRIGSAPFIHEPNNYNNDLKWTRRSEPTPSQQRQQQITIMPTSGLWAVPPRTSCPNLLAERHYQHQQQQQRPMAQLWAVPPSSNNNIHPLQRNDGTVGGDSYISSSDDSRTTAATSPPDSPREFWGERPPAEVVCQNMDKYFDNHDLDKEIIVEPQQQPPQPQPQPIINRRLTHTKSIRVVAREASKKYNRARKQSTKEGSILRRKSTKLWGQHVIEVKPKEQLQLLRENEYSMSMQNEGNTQNNNSGASVQWIRGKLIGKGSFGRVYLAFNVATGEVIAVKQVEIPKTKSDLLDSHQHDMVDALYQEIAMLRDLDHDNIVQYLGYGRDDDEGVVNIFLEYISGGSISSRLALHGAFEEPLVRHFTRQICMGIEYLHSKSILHRDIKAANILVEGDGVCKISDFGLSKKNDYDEVYDQNSRMSLRGSVYWMAPEVVKNEPYSAKVDIWSLGCTVIEMYTGQRPWLTLNQIATLYNLGCQKSPDVPEDMSDIGKDFLRQCFQIDPNKRPTAVQLLSHPFCIPNPTFEFTDYVNKGKV